MHDDLKEALDALKDMHTSALCHQCGLTLNISYSLPLPIVADETDDYAGKENYWKTKVMAPFLLASREWPNVRIYGLDDRELEQTISDRFESPCYDTPEEILQVVALVREAGNAEYRRGEYAGARERYTDCLRDLNNLSSTLHLRGQYDTKLPSGKSFKDEKAYLW